MSFTIKRSNQEGVAVASALVLITICILALLGLAYTFGYVVRPGVMGVRQITVGPQQGFSENGLGPGYHWSVPIYSQIHMIPRAVQQLHLHRNTELHPNSPGSLEVQTTDGSSVDVDITVWYRFFDTKSSSHGGPSDLLQQVGFENDWQSHILTVVVNELKKSLGRLSTSQFYNPEKREQEIANAQKEMNLRLNKDAIGIEAVLLRRYTYTEQRIDRAIFEKNLQDQEEALNAAASRFAEAKADLEKVAANWDAKILTLRVQSENQVRIVRSEADLYEKTKVAEGDLLVAQASADVERKRANVLASSSGAETFVAKELAPFLSSLKGGVIDQVDPYDLESWVDKLGVVHEQE